MSLTFVGTVAFDRIETPFGETGKIVGGAATYIGLSAINFVDKANLVSVVGEDFPQDALDDLDQKGIDREGLQIIEGGKTFFWHGKYHYDMNHRDTLETQLNVLDTFDPIIPDSYQGTKYLMLGNLTPAVQLSVLERLKERPKLIALDTMNLWLDTAWDDLMKVVSKVDLLTINDEEARQMSGEHSLVKAAQKILELGPKFLVIKKGEHGALLFDKDKVFFAPALPLEDIVDPTGAGDTYAGGMMGYLAQTDDISFDNLKRAVVIGSAMASFTVEKMGTERIREVTEQDIDERIQKFIDLVDFNIELEKA
ncbi:MAG: PfkB family carbohydrate kinase [Flavobacteriales bacterium]